MDQGANVEERGSIFERVRNNQTGPRREFVLFILFHDGESFFITL